MSERDPNAEAREKLAEEARALAVENPLGSTVVDCQWLACVAVALEQAGRALEQEREKEGALRELSGYVRAHLAGNDADPELKWALDWELSLHGGYDEPAWQAERFRG